MRAKTVIQILTISFSDFKQPLASRLEHIVWGFEQMYGLIRKYDIFYQKICKYFIEVIIYLLLFVAGPIEVKKDENHGEVKTVHKKL